MGHKHLHKFSIRKLVLETFYFDFLQMLMSVNQVVKMPATRMQTAPTPLGHTTALATLDTAEMA